MAKKDRLLPILWSQESQRSHSKDLRWFSGRQEADIPCKSISSVANKGKLVTASSFLFTHKPSDREA